MPRKGPAPRRKLASDPKHSSVLVTQLINKVMLDGKRSVAERIVYDAFDHMQQRTGADPVQTFRRAIDNVKPLLEVKSRRVGGSTYQVPIEVAQERRGALAIRWIVGAARARQLGCATSPIAASMPNWRIRRCATTLRIW